MKLNLESFFLRYYDDLDMTISTIFDKLEDILERCGTRPKTEDSTDEPRKLRDVKNGPKMCLSVEQMEDIALYLSDTSFTVQAFVKTLPDVSRFFHQQDFVQRVACFYEAIVPYYEQYSKDIKSRTLKEKWKHTKTAIVMLCHSLLDAWCIEPIKSK